MTEKTDKMISSLVQSKAAPLFSKIDLRKLIIPLIIEQTLALTVGLIDIVMITSIGESAVSGVSLVDTINLLILNLFTALATGGAIVAGQYLGRKEKENSNQAAKQLVLSTFLLSIFIMIICLFLNQNILSLFFGNMEKDVMTHASTYFYLTSLSFPFIALYNSAAALFRGMGNSKIAMINALIMNLINIIGNAIFIYVFHLDVFGAALSTLISRIIAAIAMLWMLRNPKLEIFVRSYDIRKIDFKMIKQILKIGVPNGIENCLFQGGKIILTSLIVSYGTSAIAANAVGLSIASIGVIPGFALGMAVMTVVAQCVGANEYEQAITYMKSLMKKTFLLMIIINGLILIFLDPILGMFHLSTEAFEISKQIMILHSICASIIWPIAYTLPYGYRAAGDVKYSMMISIISMWVFRIGLAYLFSYLFNMGVLGVWLAMIIDWCFRSGFFIFRWFTGKWKTNALASKS